MATSGTTTKTYTVRQIGTMAGRMCAAGLVSEGQPALTAYDGAVVVDVLNMMLKSMNVDNCQLWREEEFTLTWTADDVAIDLDTNYLGISEVRTRDDDDIDRSLTRMEWEDYVQLPDKLQSGAPVNFVFGKTIDGPVLTLWPVPDEDTTLYATGHRILEDVTSLDENIDVPQGWLETVTYNLAYRLDEQMGFAASPHAQAIKQHAGVLYQLMRNADHPASHFFSPA